MNSAPQGWRAAYRRSATTARGVTRSSRPSPEPSERITSPSATPAALRKSFSILSPASVEPKPAFSRATVRSNSSACRFWLILFVSRMLSISGGDQCSARTNGFGPAALACGAGCGGEKLFSSLVSGGGAWTTRTVPVTFTPRCSSNCFQRARRRLRGSRHRELQLGRWLPDRDRPANGKEIRPGFPRNGEIRVPARRGCRNLSRDGFERRRRLNVNRRSIARIRSWRHVHHDGVVVERDRSDRSAILEENVPHGPAFRVRIVRKITVVRDDVSVDLFQSLAHNSVGHFRKHLFDRAAALRLQLIGELAIRKVWIAAPDEHQVSGQFPIRTDARRGLQRRPELVAAAERGEGQGRRKKLGVRCRHEEVVGVQVVEDFAGVPVRNFDSPERSLCLLFGKSLINARPEAAKFVSRFCSRTRSLVMCVRARARSRRRRRGCERSRRHPGNREHEKFYDARFSSIIDPVASISCADSQCAQSERLYDSARRAALVPAKSCVRSPTFPMIPKGNLGGTE